MKTYKEYINEGIRDKMTPKSEEDIKKIAKGYMDKIKSTLDIYPMKIWSSTEQVCKYLGEERKNLYFIPDESEYYESLDEYFSSLVSQEQPLVKKVKDWYCYPSLKLAYWEDHYDPESWTSAWVFSKNNFMNDKNYFGLDEGIRDMMTPKSKDEFSNKYKNLSPQEKFVKGIKNGVLWLVKDGFENGANPKERLGDSQTPLTHATTENYLDVVKYLIEICKVNPEQQWCGNTPLKWAIIYGHRDIVEYLRSINVNESIRSMMTPKKPIDVKKQYYNLIFWKLLVDGKVPEEYKKITTHYNYTNEIAKELEITSEIKSSWQRELVLFLYVLKDLGTINDELNTELNRLVNSLDKNNEQAALYVGIKNLVNRKFSEAEIKYRENMGGNLMDQLSESVRDMMTPKSEEEIKLIKYNAAKVLKDMVDNAHKIISSCKVGGRPAFNMGEIKETDTGLGYMTYGFKFKLRKVITDRTPGKKSYHRFEINCYPMQSQRKDIEFCVRSSDDDNSWDIKEGDFYKIKNYLDRFNKFNGYYHLDLEWSLNESVRDMMTPKPVEDIRKSITKQTEPATIMLMGAEHGYLDLVKDAYKRLMKLKKKFDYYNDERIIYDSLRHACFNGHVDIVKYLLEMVDNQSFNPYLRDGSDEILRETCTKGYTDVVKILVKYGCDIHSVDEQCLRNAVYHDYIELTKFLLDNGADLHTWENYCFRYAHSDEMKELLNSYIKTNESVRDKMTGIPEDELLKKLSANFGNPTDILIKAVKSGIVEGVELALTKGADLHWHNDWCFVYSCMKGYVDIVKILIEEGADIHVMRDTASYWATIYGHGTIITILEDLMTPEEIEIKNKNVQRMKFETRQVVKKGDKPQGIISRFKRFIKK